MRQLIKCSETLKEGVEKSDKAPLVARKHPIRRLQTSAVGVCVWENERWRHVHVEVLNYSING